MGQRFPARTVEEQLRRLRWLRIEITMLWSSFAAFVAFIAACLLLRGR